MTVNRHLRIVAVLADAPDPMGIVPLTETVNRRFGRTYSPMIIRLDLVKLIDRKHHVETADGKLVSLTDEGKAVNLSSLKEQEVAPSVRQRVAA